MKWLIASDIHGSAFWCRKLLENFEKEGADRLILLGDILYHGPRNPLPAEYDPAQVAAMLNAYAQRICCVQGNCDSQVDQLVLDFPIMADYALLNHESHLIFLTHGHTHNSDTPPGLHEGDVLIHGHTHVPCFLHKGGVRYMNPGSVSLPKEDTPHSYMSFENGVFRWKDMDGCGYMEHEPW